MKRLTLVILALFSISLLSISFPKASRAQKQSNEQLGIEITTNSCSEILYFPVGLTREKGLIATVPIRDGGDVTAVRIIPVMEAGKIRFDAVMLSGTFSETMPRHGLNQLHPVKIISRLATSGETRIVSDGTNNSPWQVTVRAVTLREPRTASKEQLQFLRATAQDDDKGCGCAYCHDLRVCPNRGSCIETTCGSICCPNGEGELGSAYQKPKGKFISSVVQGLITVYRF
jgi:hypothetical protein